MRIYVYSPTYDCLIHTQNRRDEEDVSLGALEVRQRGLRDGHLRHEVDLHHQLHAFHLDVVIAEVSESVRRRDAGA